MKGHSRAFGGLLRNSPVRLTSSDLRKRVERMTGIEPAWPARKARDSKRHIGWSQPDQADAVPSVCLSATSAAGRVTHCCRLGLSPVTCRSADARPLDWRQGRRVRRRLRSDLLTSPPFWRKGVDPLDWVPSHAAIVAGPQAGRRLGHELRLIRVPGTHETVDTEVTDMLRGPTGTTVGGPRRTGRRS